MNDVSMGLGFTWYTWRRSSRRRSGYKGIGAGAAYVALIVVSEVELLICNVSPCVHGSHGIRGGVALEIV